MKFSLIFFLITVTLTVTAHAMRIEQRHGQPVLITPNATIPLGEEPVAIKDMRLAYSDGSIKVEYQAQNASNLRVVGFPLSINGSAPFHGDSISLKWFQQVYVYTSHDGYVETRVYEWHAGRWVASGGHDPVMVIIAFVICVVAVISGLWLVRQIFRNLIELFCFFGG